MILLTVFVLMMKAFLCPRALLHFSFPFSTIYLCSDEMCFSYLKLESWKILCGDLERFGNNFEFPWQDDPELDAIRQRRMRELMAKQGVGSGIPGVLYLTPLNAYWHLSLSSFLCCTFWFWILYVRYRGMGQVRVNNKLKRSRKSN